jgi:hypothetical protein
MFRTRAHTSRNRLLRHYSRRLPGHRSQRRISVWVWASVWVSDLEQESTIVSRGKAMMSAESLGKKPIQNTSQATPAKMILGMPQLVNQATVAPLLTLNDVASMLAVSKAWVRDHATRRNPRIPVVRFGGRRAVLRFRREDVTRFISEHLVSTEERGI